jgi:hypothetical protein
MWRNVAPARTHIVEESNASIIMGKQISKLRIILAVSSNQLLLTFILAHWFFSPWRWRRNLPPNYWFSQEPHSITPRKTAFFIVTTEKIWNLTRNALLQVAPASTIYTNIYENVLKLMLVMIWFPWMRVEDCQSTEIIIVFVCTISTLPGKIVASGLIFLNAGNIARCLRARENIILTLHFVLEFMLFISINRLTRTTHEQAFVFYQKWLTN